MHGYVIYSEKNADSLSAFFKQDNTQIFHPLMAVEPTNLDGIALENYINTKAIEKKLHRFLTALDVSQTLSQIKCWQTIAQNNDIHDDEFVLIADAGIHFVNNWFTVLEHHLSQFLNHSKYQIFILARSTYDSFWVNNIYNGEHEFGSIIFTQPYAFDGVGTALYAIRKSKIKEILAQLISRKPYWLADHFSEICDYQLITQANAFLATPSNYQTFKYYNHPSPLFSVIIPVYNVEKYLNQAIDSVLKQDYYNYEIILVNDGSSDQSSTICMEYAQKYPHIRFIHKPNAGLSHTRNVAMKIATGKYIMFLDSDDYWQGNNIFADLESIIQEKEPDLILNQLTSLYPDNKLVPHVISSNKKDGSLAKDLLELINNEIFLGYAWTKIIKREKIEKNNLYFPEGRNYEDILWSVKLAKVVESYAIYHSDFYVYRRERDGAITRFVSEKNMNDLFYIFSESIDELNKTYPSLPIYKGIHRWVKNLSTYIEICYSLLNEEQKKRFVQQYANFHVKLNKLDG